MKEIKFELPIVDLSGVCESMNELKKAVEEYRKREVIVRLGTALIENGVKCSAIIEDSDEEVILDFSEHDKMVAEEKDALLEEMRKNFLEVGMEKDAQIRELKRQIEDLEDMRKAWMETAVKWSEENEVLKSQINDLKDIVENEKLAELEDRHQSDCIRINQLLATIDVLTERYQKLREVHGL